MKIESCENCHRKKRKCGKEQPSCVNCIQIGVDCTYTDSKKPGPKPGRSKALEERLKKLEAIVDSLNLDETDNSDSIDADHISQAQSFYRATNNSTSHVIPASPSPSMPSFPVHVDALRTDLEELFHSTSAGYLMLDEHQTKKAIQESIFLRFVVYALAAMVAPPSMVSAEFGSRQEMAEMYFKRSESFLRRIFRKPSFHGVIGLFGLVVYCTRTEKGPEAFYYYTVAVRIAISIGLNKERVYASSNLSEDQKEIMRRTWWTLYMGDRIVSALRFEAPLIKDSDCQALFPNSNILYSHPQDRMNETQLAIMSSTEWYTPTPRNLSSPHCYLIILVKIHSRIITLSQRTHETTKNNFYYQQSAIRGSLRDWYNAIPEEIRNVYGEISKDTPPAIPKKTWFNAFIMILYNCIRMHNEKHDLFLNIEESVSLAASSSAAREVFLSGCDLAGILTGFLKHNPSFFYAPPFVAASVFGAGLMVMTVSRLDLNPTDIQMSGMTLQAIISTLTQHSVLYNIGTDQKIVLERLLTCHDPILLTIALKSMKNMKGEIFSESSANLLSLDAEDPDFEMPQLTTLSMLGDQKFKNQELLQSVASMSNPYSDLMMGVSGTAEDSTFDQLFNFTQGK